MLPLSLLLFTDVSWTAYFFGGGRGGGGEVAFAVLVGSGGVDGGGTRSQR